MEQITYIQNNGEYRTVTEAIKVTGNFSEDYDSIKNMFSGVGYKYRVTGTKIDGGVEVRAYGRPILEMPHFLALKDDYITKGDRGLPELVSAFSLVNARQRVQDAWEGRLEASEDTVSEWLDSLRDAELWEDAWEEIPVVFEIPREVDEHLIQALENFLTFNTGGIKPYITVKVRWSNGSLSELISMDVSYHRFSPASQVLLPGDVILGYNNKFVVMPNGSTRSIFNED
jgi:hypothetical protein